MRHAPSFRHALETHDYGDNDLVKAQPDRLNSRIFVSRRPFCGTSLVDTGRVNPYALDYPTCNVGGKVFQHEREMFQQGLGDVVATTSSSGVGGTIARAQREALKTGAQRAWAEARVFKNSGRPVLQASYSTPYEPCAEDYTIP